LRRYVAAALTVFVGLAMPEAHAREVHQKDLPNDGFDIVERGPISQYTLLQGGAVQVGSELLLGRPRALRGASKRIQPDVAVHAAGVFFSTLWDPQTWDKELIQPHFVGTTVTVTGLQIAGDRGEARVTAQLEVVRGPEGARPGVHISCSDLDRALANGELQPPHGPYARERALEALEEAKRLLDLGMMSTEDFEARKAEWAPLLAKDPSVFDVVPYDQLPSLPEPTATEPEEGPEPDPTPDDPHPTTIETSVRTRGGDGLEATRLVRRALERDHDALTLCFSSHNQSAKADFALKKPGEVTRLAVEGDGSQCIHDILAGWTTRPPRYLTPVTVTLVAKVDPELDRPKERVVPEQPEPPRPSSVAIEVRPRGQTASSPVRVMQTTADQRQEDLVRCFTTDDAPATVVFTLRMDGTLGRLDVDGADEECLATVLGSWTTDPLDWPAKMEMTVTPVWALPSP